MVNVNAKQVAIYLSVIFLLTAALSYFFADQYLIESGFLVAIILTVFINGTKATVITSLAVAAAVLTINALKSKILLSSEFIAGNIFIFVIISFTTLVVLYIKRLLAHMQFDKKHMTSLFENATEGIILTNGTGKVVLVNPSAERIFGYRQDELVNRFIEILIPAKFKPDHDKRREDFYKHPQNRQMGVGRDLLARKKDGTEFPVEVSLSYYRQDNEPFVIAFVVDITARKNIELTIKKHQLELERLTENMRILNAALEEKVEQRTRFLTEALQKLEQSKRELDEALSKEKELNEIKGRFVSMASHEFRTPLTTILSSASLLSKYKEGGEQDKRDRHIDHIKDSVKHLNDILEDFLSLGKLGEGKVPLSLFDFDLNELIEDVIEEMKVQAKNSQHIEYHYKGTHAVYSDEKLLRLIVINLISNAIKFSNEGKTIKINCQVTDNMVTISITDQGIGIAEEDQQHLFSSFFRGKNAINIQGTGLGLHIVQRYVNLLNGTIHLHSVLEKGTTFIIDLPAQKPTI